MIRVVQFADIINRHDFIDTIVQHAAPGKFDLAVCVRSAQSNIAAPVHRSETRTWVLQGGSRREIPRAAIQLARILREFDAHVVHAHHFDQMVIAWLATRLHRATRLVLGRHYSDSIYRLPRGPRQSALLRLEGCLNRAADRIVAPSHYIRKILTEWQGVNGSKIDLVPYGFVPEKYPRVSPEQIRELRASFGLSQPFVIGTFARLHEEKGHRYLAAALAEHSSLSNVGWVIVGEGPERQRLEEDVRRRALQSRVRFLGWRRDAMAVMGAVDAVVQPTLQEAFSQVMAESLWMGKPLVMTDVSGAPDILVHQENGLLVPRADPDALASAIQRLAWDPGFRTRLGISGQEYVNTYLRADQVIPRYEEVYRKAIRG